MRLDTIKSAQKGDRSALGLIVSDCYDRVFRFCARRVGEDLGQDATQETFITMQRSIARFRQESKFETWLLGIANKTCQEAVRKKGKDHLPLEEWFEPTDNRQGQVIERESLRQALANLSPAHREAVVMHEIEGLTYGEIAAILGVPEGTVKSRLHHAFILLREMLVGEQK
jgi:RNA polymerase sigma-70 factor (ECF subfamily)